MSARKPVLVPGETCRGIHAATATGLLVDACSYYQAFYEAAEKAESFILIAGWQFDSTVHILRGEATQSADTRLLPFLSRLCETKPYLRVYILAWDFSMLFALEREWFQDFIFNWNGHERILFRFDDTHAVGGSHHQKFVVIDGAIGFVGGVDLCSARWDDRRHLAKNPLRTGTDGKEYDPYHDVQTYHTGPAARELEELFLDRWVKSGGEAPDLLHPPERRRFTVRHRLPVHACRVAISRTSPRTLITTRENIREIRELYLRAIDSAEHLIYIENQYFSSDAVFAALTTRMRAHLRPKLDIVIVIPQRPQAVAEELSHGITQMKMLQALRETARRTGHSLGIYYPLAAGRGRTPMVYVHSKVLLVDDRFLTAGSANTTNRSMGLDTELNVAWEAEGDDRRFERSLRMIRVSLLAEHAGLSRISDRRKLRRMRGLTAYLDEVARDARFRLRIHTLDTLFDRNEWLSALQDQSFELDPESPLVEEAIFEVISQETLVQFANGIAALGTWLGDEAKSQGGALRVVPVPEITPSLPPDSSLSWKLVAVMAVLVLLLLFFTLRAAGQVLY